MREVLAGILTLAISGMPALAQMPMQSRGPMNGQMAGPMRPAPMAMPMPPPLPAAVPASRLAKVKEFLAASGTRDLIEAYVQRVSPMAIMMVQRQLKPTDIAAQKDAAAAMNIELKSSANEILDNTARYYAGHFSDPELDAMTAFFKSPAGKKFIGLRQVLQQDSSNALRAWAMKMQTVTMKNVIQNVAKAHPGSLAVPPAPAAQPARPGGAPK